MGCYKDSQLPDDWMKMMTIWREKDQREGAAQARLEGMEFLDQIFLNNFYEK